MYLKRLQVQGFKTFAQKTEFLYDSGVTAIVGPNGSGKSNIADAIRWVLGEQRYSVLRGRKTEDVIFAGSALKSPMGYAEASITFDNADGKLPLNFSEVTITRRAYRSGENEYYINKSRVRLKDITEATLPLSQTYTVITQGMVDAALSQKPEERRGLFEDAASIGLYNLKKAEAENNLARQEDNARHIEAMLSEVEPRLKVLERHARQAEEFYTVREELQLLLKRFYGDRWHKNQAALEKALIQEETARLALEAGKAELEKLQEGIGAARDFQSRQRNRLGELHHESSLLHNRAQQLQQQVAVEQERLNGAGRQRETHEQELAGLEISLESNTARLKELEQEYAAVVAGQNDETAALAAQEALVKTQTAAALEAETALERQRREAMRLANQFETLKHRQSQLAERRASLSRQVEQFNQNRDSLKTRQAEIEAEITREQGLVAELEEQGRQLDTRRQNLAQEAARLTETIRKSERTVQETRAKLDSARSRLELLNRLQSNFTGLYGGVKSVMQAASAPTGGPKPALSGILGLVANLLQAPAELEVAIEVALGGHLQDVVVESFEDAEAAIGYLKKAGAGRATFLPLDNLRGGGSGGFNRQLLKKPGVRGIASELIEYEGRFAPVYEQLLGRVVVVEDVQVGRAALRELTGAWTAVTLGGEILRSSGAVTGGATGKDKDRAEGSVLMRERTLRELPVEISRLESQLRQAQAELAAAQTQAAAAQRQGTELDKENQQLLRRQLQQREKVSAVKNQLDRLTYEGKLREENQQSVVGELKSLETQEKQLAAETAETRQTHETAGQQTAELERAARLANAATNDEREKLAALRTATALAGQRLKTSAETLRFVQTENGMLKNRVAERKRQLADLETRCQLLARLLGEAQAEMAGVGRQLETLRQEITPLEKQLAQLDQEQAGHEKEWSSHSATILSLDTAYGRASLEVQRLRGELETLQVRAADDLAPSMQLDGALNEDNIAPPVSIDPADWEELLELTDRESAQLGERIEQLRNRLRRIGGVNPLAMQEFRETKQRYEFLSSQLRDLSETGQTLRSLIKELDEVTQARFGATFDRVAEEFKRFFALLFNGGSARLVLTQPDNLAETGIEILAQPPGKKQQILALFSGGERALTAVALLFALLEVNPSPFCVLDEVDAALDESNVGRFCETLRTLAHKTQFIVITHNRGTIEAARTIYGVSMGPDSISKIMSLRVDEVTDFKVHGSKLKRSAALVPETAEPVLN
ncbi:MAG: chromosome segregation protein SMC [Chloroflexi bacterium]|nr:chromosome segregation protein SMC [Chloroflexota bacterium]OJW06477.1 MAG: chromosome segregation protein SMC [Chloroflexi bacterium 54-19]